MIRRRRAAWLAIAGALALTACGGNGRADDADVEPLSIFGPYRGEDADRFSASLQQFVDDTGIDVRYVGSANFVADLVTRTAPGGRPPDVAMVPQPGLFRQLAERGAITELGEATRRSLETNHRDIDRQLGEIDGVAYAVPFRLNVKSLVWYRPDVFAANGWSIPGTLDELDELVEQVLDDGSMSPWCLTLQAGSATGWPATDWVEDLVLRRSGPDAYERWATGELAFASDTIRDAFVEFRRLVIDPPRLYGGTSYATDNFTTSIFEALLDVEPGCAMAKQADFAASWLPPATTIGPDGEVNWFVLPGAERDRAPLVVGGDLAVQFTRSAEADALLTYLAGPDGGAAWARRGGLISPAITFDLDNYPDESERALAQLLVDADELVFDASDEMPADVGSTLFWTTITAWLTGSIDYETLATTLDGAYETYLGAVQLPIIP